MKFKFCSDGDCPLWALSALHSLSTLPAPLFKQLVEKVIEENSDDSVIELLKDTNLSSRAECARAAGAVRWVRACACACACGPARLARDLLLLGVPRAHANALAHAVSAHAQQYEHNAKTNGFSVNKITDVSVTEGPQGSVDTYKLTLHTDNTLTGVQKRKDLLIDKTQAKVLLEELKKAHEKMEEVEKSLSTQNE